MYGLVNYQLTGIQKGIQFLHAVVEYSRLVNRMGGEHLENYNQWADKHKTVIILNGGSTNDRKLDGVYLGTLNRHKEELDKNNILNSTFYESDLGDQLTSVVFIVDERVFNKVKYPDFEDWFIENYDNLIKDKTYTTSGNAFQMAKSIKESSNEEEFKIEYEKWIHSIGGYQNLFLREFLNNFRLA